MSFKNFSSSQQTKNDNKTAAAPKPTADPAQPQSDAAKSDVAKSATAPAQPGKG